MALDKNFQYDLFSSGAVANCNGSFLFALSKNIVTMRRCDYCKKLARKNQVNFQVSLMFIFQRDDS